MSLFVFVDAVQLLVRRLRAHFSCNRKQLGCALKVKGGAYSPGIASAQTLDSTLVACLVCRLVVVKCRLAVALYPKTSLILPADTGVRGKITQLHRLFEEQKRLVGRAALKP